MDNQPIPKSQIFNSLPGEWNHDFRAAIRRHIEADCIKVVVLDDDPTGTQTIHGLTVLTEWSVESLAIELKDSPKAFYILTNTRSGTIQTARRINAEIGRNLSAAAKQTSQQFVVISRSDSTLRGHFPGEIAALSESLAQKYDGWILIPFFLEGGRYTIDNIHYVEEDGILVPAAQTEFARDRVFGYSTSNLCDWVAEKTNGQIASEDVISISIENLRKGGPESVKAVLMGLHNGDCCIVNAVSYRDIEVFVQGLLVAEARGKKFLFRTAASFVQVRTGISPRPLLSHSDFQLHHAGGGLIVVGSYVPRSTKQINSLLSEIDISNIEISVDALVDDRFHNGEISRAVKYIEKTLRQGKDILIFTSRLLKTGKDPKSNLQIGQKISQGLINVVRRIQTTPRYILAKGGITSSDIATKALNVKRALVLGQILPGVPVWKLGEESRFPGITYIVFPGNVGNENALLDTICQLRRR